MFYTEKYLIKGNPLYRDIPYLYVYIYIYIYIYIHTYIYIYIYIYIQGKLYREIPYKGKSRIQRHPSREIPCKRIPCKRISYT